MSFFLKNKKLGFTLIELLVVVAIIGVLASVVMVSLNSAREKGRDARRLSDLKQIQTALEMYYDDHGYYPQRNYAYTSSASCGGTATWCSLVIDLAPYLSSIPGDPLGKQDTYRYYYDSDLGDNYQTYGIYVNFESSSNNSKESSDGGYNPALYEVGQQPVYCMNTIYFDLDRWWGGSGTDVCTGGN